MILRVPRASSALPAYSTQISAPHAQKIQKTNILYANTKTTFVWPNVLYVHGAMALQSLVMRLVQVAVVSLFKIMQHHCSHPL